MTGHYKYGGHHDERGSFPTLAEQGLISASAAGCVVVLSRGKALRIMAEVARLEEAHNDGHPFPDAST